ncbi:hypothetical protein RHMOL_Rhmol08G0135900 [Rhododendron molle]|uniref:Uncharacterized protein n=1 Tax=Rhododendron molle TaxID=49168 RepID=A0ACC0MNC5_RHOML|nr:hypothetical protein RHMOL_Rhmol08G0135900 [Rhododendron molle]
MRFPIEFRSKWGGQSRLRSESRSLLSLPRFEQKSSLSSNLQLQMVMCDYCWRFKRSSHYKILPLTQCNN